MKRIVIVPGHSFKDPGAINKKLGVREYDYCLERALELFKEDNWEDIDIILKSRNKNYSSLPNEINSLKPDFILELHLNAANGVAQGTEVLCSGSEKGKTMAGIIQNNLVNKLGLDDRGVKIRGRNDRGGYLLHATNAPCVIIEPFFLDSTSKLYDEEVCEALRASIRQIVDEVK